VKPERIRQLQIAMLRWEANIKMNLKVIIWEDMGWIHVNQVMEN
jgi:hypothetical protein